MAKRPSTPKRPLPPLLRLAPWTLLLTSLLWAIGCALALNLPTDTRHDLAVSQVRYAVDAEAVGDNRRADDILNSAVGILNGKGSAFAEVGRQLLRHGRPNMALRLLKAATTNPSVNDDPNVYLVFSLAQHQVSNAAAAKLALDEAERRAASLLAGKSGVKDQERVEELITVGDFWADPENPRASSEKALSAYRAAYEFMPSSPDAERELAYALANFGTTDEQFKEARTLAGQAVEQSPGDGRALDALGWSLFKSDDLAGAERVLREAVEEAGDAPETHFHLGAVFAKSKQFRDAAIELNRALQLWPEYKAAQTVQAALPADALPTATPTPAPPPLNAPVSAPAVSAAASPLPSPSPSVAATPTPGTLTPAPAAAPPAGNRTP